MQPNSEEFLRCLLKKNYAILEQYSSEIEGSRVEEERVEEILVQVKSLAVSSMRWLLDLIPYNSDPVHSECLESSLNYLQYALVEIKAPTPSRRKVLKKALYHSKMALLSFYGWWHLLLPELFW